MKKSPRLLVVSLLLTLFSLPTLAKSRAVDLVEVYREARLHDPTLASAHAANLSTQEVYPQARAGLLPQIALTGTLLRNKQKNRNPILPATPTGYAGFGAHEFIISLSQPLFNYANWMALKQASAVVKQSEATYYAAEQDLIFRVADAYFNVLEARDTLRFTRAEKRATGRQLEQAQQRYKVGLDAITSVYEAQAAYDAVVANLIAAENNLLNRREDLRAITGKYYPKLAQIRGLVPLLRPDPTDVEAWVRAAEKHNYALRAARYALEAARQGIKINRAGHLPVLNLIASGQDRNIGSPRGRAARLDTRTGNIGLQIDLPIFESGLVISKTRQAKYDYQKSTADLEGTYRSTINTTRQAYNIILSGISNIKANRQAVKSTASSVESTEAGFKVGTRTIIDVLDQQKKLFDAQRNLAATDYLYIKATLALKQAAGTLSVADLEKINTWLDTPTAHTTIERFKRHRTPHQKLQAKIAKTHATNPKRPLTAIDRRTARQKRIKKARHQTHHTAS